MENNCLVTKLNGVVNNDNLLKLGELRFVLNEGATGFFSGIEALTLEIVSGNGVFSDVGSSINKVSNKKIIVPANATDDITTRFGISGGNATISLSSKYALTMIKVSGAGGNLNTEDLQYSKLSWVVASDVDFFNGDIKYINENLEFCQIASNIRVTGDVKDCPNVSINLRIQDTGLFGTMESYVEKLFHKGYLKNNESCYFGGGNITLDGRTWSSGYECFITVTSESATIAMGSYVNKTYNGITWTNN